MAERELSSKTVQSLSKKLDEFAEALTSEEHAVLLGLLSAASATFAKGHQEAEAESGTFVERPVVISPDRNLPSLSAPLRETFRTLPGFDPIGPVSDSIGVGVVCVSWSKDYNMPSGADRVTRPQLGGVEGLRIPGLRTIR